ncbi:HET-domain-containing protein [Hypoxylon trugodes]|uniref:HET-domain-containing protein n=1 Tax=Hypoxylon trugodes TaxID=326681 RepID=UPI00219CDDAC|nr:HET-domain-containing protein [Hypoxylon trugodes]KAI1385563.1 HET-domain-containing protein [Hypoxylon trugodes]
MAKRFFRTLGRSRKQEDDLDSDSGHSFTERRAALRSTNFSGDELYSEEDSIYEPLNISKFETRFLKVIRIPRNPTKRMSFEIEKFSLSRPPNYLTLSYCWGDITHLSSIRVSGNKVYISKNLESALRHSGFEPGDYIWADAICINQDDDNEKAHQIGLMGHIYSKAQETAVWLGEESRDTPHAYDLITEIQALASNSHMNFIPSDEFASALRDTYYPIRSLRGLYELLTRPYWERVWIIQEIAKSQKVKVRCGTYCFDLAALLAISEHVDDLSKHNHTLISAIQEFREQEISAQRGGLRMPLLQALIRSRHSLATNPRDKVYALLNLTRDGNDLIPMPSYTESAGEIFRDLTMTFRRSPYAMESIILSPWVPLVTKSKAHSWAVDWADLAFNIPPWLASNISTRYIARSGEEPNKLLEFSKELRVRVKQLVKIESISDASMAYAVQQQVPVEKAPSIMISFCSTLWGTFFSKTPKVPHAELVWALVYIIAYDRSQTNWDSRRRAAHTQDVIKQLSWLIVDSFPLAIWARECLSNRTAFFRELASTMPTEDARTFYSLRDEHGMQSTGISLSDKISPLNPLHELSVGAMHVWDELLSSLDMRPEYGFQFAICNGGDVVLVPYAAREEDRIYQVHGCHLPVILRKNFFIGEACIGIDSDGHWIAARDYPRTAEADTTKYLYLRLRRGTDDD